MKRISILLLAASSFAVPACTSDATQTGGDDDGTNPGSGSGSQDEWDTQINSRVTDYNAALRIASLRLVGDLPTVTEINQIANAPDDAGKKAAYETIIRDYMGRPAFAKQMFAFWQDTFKIGGTAAFDTAPAFAAKLSVENGSYMDLFTKASANCPTFNATAGTFADAECTNGGPKAGVLTNPGVMASYTSNLAFRRVRWVQETFDCLRFPAELGGTPIDVGGASLYSGMWPFTSVASPTNGGGRVNFQDVSSTLCINCHQTINHIAPLFGNYDATGAYKTTIQVTVPLTGAPLAAANDWLPPGETTAWRYMKPAADIPGLGTAMTQDPAVSQCGVARIWNWALGKTDIVDTLQEVPAETIKSQVDAFTQNGYKMKDLIFAVFTSSDFVAF
jgi:Protein of unknown function (DUF1588)